MFYGFLHRGGQSCLSVSGDHVLIVCKVNYRGFGESQVLEKRLSQVQALVRPLLDYYAMQRRTPLPSQIGRPALQWP